MSEKKDVGDPVAVSRRKSKQTDRRFRELEDLRELLSTSVGRKILWRLLDECKIFSTSFTGNNTTFFREGRRDVGLWLVKEISDADVNMFGRMMAEAKERDDTNA